MILDATDLEKVLSKALQKALFENHFLVQGKNIRYLAQDADFLKLAETPESEGGFNSDEYSHYEKNVNKQISKKQAEESAKNFHALPLDEVSKSFPLGKEPGK